MGGAGRAQAVRGAREDNASALSACASAVFARQRVIRLRIFLTRPHPKPLWLGERLRRSRGLCACASSAAVVRARAWPPASPRVGPSHRAPLRPRTCARALAQRSAAATAGQDRCARTRAPQRPAQRCAAWQDTFFKWAKHMRALARMPSRLACAPGLLICRRATARVAMLVLTRPLHPRSRDAPPSAQSGQRFSSPTPA